MPPFTPDPTKTYLLHNDWSGPSKILAAAPSSDHLEMIDRPPSSSQHSTNSQWRFIPTTRPAHYRLHTLASGPERPLDVINDQGVNSQRMRLAARGNFSGQFWRVDTWDDEDEEGQEGGEEGRGFKYKLSNLFTGPDRCLDVYADTFGPHLAGGGYIGQHWTIEKCPPPPSSLPSSSSSSSAGSSSVVARIQSSDQVQDMKIDVRAVDGGLEHRYTVSEEGGQRRVVSVVDRWEREGPAGRGVGVWVERCVEGGRRMGSLRAVKEIRVVDGDVEERGEGEVVAGVGSHWREVRALAKFSQQKYVHCFVQATGWWDTDHQSPKISVAMEYLPLGDLEQALSSSSASGTVPEREARVIVAQLVEGLRMMHAQGFAHRDLNPQNILVVRSSPDWWVKISDFSQSIRVSDGPSPPPPLPQHRNAVMPGYAAPETLDIFTLDELRVGHDRPPAARDDFAIAAAALDIWALGQVAFRILAGRPAFRDLGELSRYVVLGQPIRWGSLEEEGGVSAEGREFIRRCLCGEAAGRPAAEELGRELWIKYVLLVLD